MKIYGLEILAFILIIGTLFIFFQPLLNSALEVKEANDQFQSNIKPYDPSSEDFDEMERFKSSLNKNNQLSNSINNLVLILTSMLFIMIIIYSIIHTIQLRTIKKKNLFKTYLKNFGILLALLISFLFIFWIYAEYLYLIALNKTITTIFFWILFLMMIFLYLFFTRVEPKIKIKSKIYLRLVITFISAIITIFVLLNIVIISINLSTITISFIISFILNLIIIFLLMPVVFALTKLIFNYY